MANPIVFCVKESVAEIKKLIRKSNPFFVPRLNVLLECKKNETTGISKLRLAEKTGVDPNSVQKWRHLYIKGGITVLLSHKKKGNRPSVFTKEDHKKIEEKLNDAKNSVRGFVELQRWIKDNLSKEVNYKTLHRYVKFHFKAKVKVARKSHIKKDVKQEEAFKKTSVQSAEKK